MGWEISHNKDGYQIISSITDEVIHEKERLTEEEVKELMAERALFEFFEKLITIDKDFLNGYQVNGKTKIGESTAIDWIHKNYDTIPHEALSIMERLLNITIKDHD